NVLVKASGLNSLPSAPIIVKTGKKLTTAGGPTKPGPDMKQMMIWGNVVAAQREDDSEQQELIPSSWQLIRRSESGTESVLAKAVLSYDLCPHGTIVYSTGSAIHTIDPDGKKEKILTGEMIEQVVALPTSA
ncbi:MAG: hypothetical protein ACPGVU_07210, partial [Limisphaerales bacterium]